MVSLVSVAEWDIFEQSVSRTATGHPVLDRVVGRLLNEWRQAFESSDDDFGSRFEHLHEQVFLHCHEEDAMMQGFGYPQAEAHMQDHERLLEQMDDINSMLLSGDVVRARRGLIWNLLPAFCSHVRRFGPDLAEFLVRCKNR